MKNEMCEWYNTCCTIDECIKDVAKPVGCDECVNNLRELKLRNESKRC